MVDGVRRNVLQVTTVLGNAVTLYPLLAKKKAVIIVLLPLSAGHSLLSTVLTNAGETNTAPPDTLHTLRTLLYTRLPKSCRKFLLVSVIRRREFSAATGTVYTHAYLCAM